MSTGARGERIVVIEDEPDILAAIHYGLEREGYRVLDARDGDEGLELIRREFPDAVLLDLMLPGSDGLTVCRRLKADPVLRSIPVVMVTAKDEEDDIVAGLEAGADDYVSKPFGARELLARLRAVLRRGTWDDARPRERLVFGGVAIDTGRHEVRVDGEPVALTATEFRLLHYLAAHPGRVLSRAQLLERAVGGDAALIDRNVDVHVGAIRRKLGPYRQTIETVRGVGYRLRDG